MAAAKQYSGITLTTIRETGPQAADDKLFGGPLWKKLTGMNVKTVEGSVAEIYRSRLPRTSRTRASIDVVEALGSWIPDFADRGVIVPIDDYLKKYKGEASLKDIHPVYRSFATYKGKTWGFSDDGDAWALYYRKDIFGDAQAEEGVQGEVQARSAAAEDMGRDDRDLAVHHRSAGSEGLRPGMARALGNPGNYYYFFQTFRSLGGQFFDPKTMKAQINERDGRQGDGDHPPRAEASPPGSEKFDFLTMWTTWLQGKTAMIYTWPPTGRI